VRHRQVASLGRAPSFSGETRKGMDGLTGLLGIHRMHRWGEGKRVSTLAHHRLLNA
jgi:hypothetical protein